ncbi:MAG: S8 family serine peptidase [Pseudomonadota bacterium]|nr:S8 family serine peptidase [Pseudomonadota bacterium]
MDPELWELLEEGDSEDEIAAIVRLGQPNIVPKGVRVIAQFGDIATLRMKREDIHEVRAEEGVTSLKPAEPHGFGLAPDLELDPIEPAEGLSEAEPWIYERRPPSLPETGRGVVCGVVDWGFDFAHPDFRHDDGRTRILALWDQRPPPSPKSPQPYGYGIVYTAEDINHALAAENPYAVLGYHPADVDIGGRTHGTHVASIAAGNGRGCGLTGVAPEADLALVDLSTWDRTELAKLGDSVTLLEAVHFIVRTADKRPWVINLSMGRHGEQHDGSTPIEQGLDAALRSAPGGCIVQSCGNYFQRRIHASGQLRPAEKRTLVWEIEDADITPNKLEVWYEGRDVFDVEIRSPDGSISAHAALGERASLTAGGRDIGTLYHRRYDPNALDNHIVIILYTGGPTGPWELTLIGKDVTDGRYHCWIERDSVCPDCQSRFRPEDAVPSSTTGTICNGFRTIAVGAYNPHSPERELTSFSSAGKTRDGRFKPDCIAPGESILAARSAPRDPRAEVPPWTLMSGTSMAAPHVAGAVACMFQAAERPLRIEETRNLLLANTERVTAPEEVLDRVGSGYLDITRAVEAARKMKSGAPQLQRTLHRESEGDTVNRENNISSTRTWDQDPPQENGESNPLGDPNTVSFEAYESREPGTRDADEEWGSEPDDRLFEEEEDEEPAVYENVEATEQELYETDVVNEQTSTSSSATEIDAFGLVELADQMIAERAVARAPTQVLHDVLSRAGMAESLTPLGSGRLLSAAELFDAFAYPGREALRDQLGQNFEVVAPPRAPLDGRLHTGDLLIRRGEAGLGHLSVIASPELRGYEELLSEGLIPEIKGPGKYAQVVETGARPHTLSDAFARGVVDATGRLPYGQMVLRTREHVRQRIAEGMHPDESVIPPDLIESFSGRVLLTGWTTFMPFELNGKPHYLAYDSSTGAAWNYRILPSARPDPKTKEPVEVIKYMKWDDGWTTFMPFKLSGDARTHYLAYKAKTGEVRIDRIRPDGKGVDTIWGTPLDPKIKWAPDWTHFMPFTLGGKPYYLAYQSGTGEERIDRIKADGKGMEPIWQEPLPQGRKTGATFMPFEVTGKPHYLWYDSSTGNVSISRIKPDGKGADVIWGTPFDFSLKWTPGWTHFMPFTLDGKPHYLAYMAGTGEVRIDRIKADGKGVDKTIWGTPKDPNFKWAPDWTTIMPFKMEGKPHYLAYSKTSGWVEIRSIAEELGRCVSPGVTRDDPTALNLSAVGTDDFSVTLTVRGTSYEVKGNVFYPGQKSGAHVPFNTKAVAGGKAPIVFIAHGNHALFHDPANRLHERATNPGSFVPIANHKGYEYFQQLLAQMGIISVSVDCNQFGGAVGLDPPNIENRADLVLGAIQHFQSLHKGSDPIFGGHIDFGRVGLVGHSRGGEAVLVVPELLALAATGISGLAVKGVISIAPTDIGATKSRPAGFAFMTILPAADLDVRPNYGAKFYDQASADPFKCQLYIHDANHNFFNTQWVSDDLRKLDPATGLLPKLRSSINVMNEADERAFLTAYGCAFFRTVLLGHDLRKFMEGLEIPPGVARFRDCHISFERTGPTIVDDNEDHDIDRNALGKRNSKSGRLTADEYEFGKTSGAFNGTFYGNTRGMVAQSSTASGLFRWDLGAPMDLTGREILVRTAEVYDGSSVPVEATGFKLGLEDARRKKGFIDSDDVGGLPRPYDRRKDDVVILGTDYTKTMLKTLRFPVSCIRGAEPGFHTTKVQAILLRMDRKDGRALAFDQLQIA